MVAPGDGRQRVLPQSAQVQSSQHIKRLWPPGRAKNSPADDDETAYATSDPAEASCADGTRPAESMAGKRDGAFIVS